MVPLLVIAAGWIAAALATGIGLGRVIARADHHSESSLLPPDLRHGVASP